MAYITGEDRRQYTMFPDCIEDYIEQDAPVRLFDAFVNKLDMEALGFVRSKPAEEGRPGYDPRDLLKILIYGYFYTVRSSRRLARECKCNIEVMWLVCKLSPDFRTLSDFRKDNKDSITKTFREFNKFCASLNLFSKSYISIDGSKFKAVNAKDRNFTLSKLDDRILRLDEHIRIYMEELDACDEEESRKLSKEELQHKLDVCKDRKERYEQYRKQMEESGDSQMSLTDPEAKLMKQNEGFGVCYNTQVAVDAGSHLVAGFEVTNDPTDHGHITHLAQDVKADMRQTILEATADKGYECPEDIANALSSGIIPNVITRNGESKTTVTFSYNEAEITEEQKASTSPEDLKACLESGVIPDAYKDILSDIQIKEAKSYVPTGDIPSSDILKMTPDEMRQKALEGYFVRDPHCNLVYCPQGHILRQKSIKRNGMIRYCNKLACKHCKCKCTKSEWKETDFDKDTLIKGCKGRTDKKDDTKEDKKDNGPKAPKKVIVSKIVSYILHLDEKKMDQRKCLSEHPFGTVKRSLGSYYFLLKGKAKVTAESALFFLSYNIRRAINLRSVPTLLAALG